MGFGLLKCRQRPGPETQHQAARSDPDLRRRHSATRVTCVTIPMAPAHRASSISPEAPLGR